MMKLYWWLRNCWIQESGEQGTLLLDEWVSLGVWVYLGNSVFFENVISWFSIWCGGVQVQNWPELGMLFSWKLSLIFLLKLLCWAESSLLSDFRAGPGFALHSAFDRSVVLIWLLLSAGNSTGSAFTGTFFLSVLMSALIVLVLPFQVFQSSLYSKGKFPWIPWILSLHSVVISVVLYHSLNLETGGN